MPIYDEFKTDLIVNYEYGFADKGEIGMSPLTIPRSKQLMGNTVSFMLTVVIAPGLKLPIANPTANFAAKEAGSIAIDYSVQELINQIPE